MLKTRCLRNRRSQLFVLSIVFIFIFIVSHETVIELFQGTLEFFQRSQFTSHIQMDRTHLEDAPIGLDYFNGTELSLFRGKAQNKSTEGDTRQLNDILYEQNDFYDLESKLFPCEKSGKSTKVILLYTTLFGDKRWTSLVNELTTHLQDVNCPVQNCEITYDRTKVDRADAVIFHGVDLLWDKEFQSQQLLTISRPSWQRWVFFMHEPPMKNEKDYSTYNWIFNWTASYRRKSDIFVPYFRYEKIAPVEKKSIGQTYADETEEEQNTITNYAEGKTGLVAWAVSHCGLIREKFALELQRYIRITVYGRCSDRFDNPGYSCRHRTVHCIETLSKYKFYLAFESGFCDDYITEKYWENAIKVNSVPVVLGANYDSELVIPGSFIDVDKFSSIEELANYLNYLDKNDTAYNEYFQWKKIYRMVNFHPVCAFCQKLHNQSIRGRVYHNIGRFWSVAEQCEPFKDKENKLWDLIQKSKTVDVDRNDNSDSRTETDTETAWDRERNRH